MKHYDLEECISTEKHSNKPLPYNESSVVTLLEDTGIGRPSTYATIIATLYNRKYTVIQDIKQEDIELKIRHLTKDNKIIKKVDVQKGKIVKKRIQTTPLGRKVLNI